MPRFSKSNDGLVHLLNTINWEFTLCGNAFDGDALSADMSSDPNAHCKCKERVVTCPSCIEIIRSTRRVRCREEV
jgi:hypothetical protein